MSFLNELINATRSGELEWRETQEKESFCMSNCKALIVLQGYIADYKAYSLKIIVRRVSHGFNKVPLVGLRIERNGRKITLVSQPCRNSGNQFLGKQIILEEGTVTAFAIEMQNIIKRRDSFGSLDIELEKVMRDQSPNSIDA